jgi:hypothetical protein
MGIMGNEFDDLVQVMKEAREKADIANDRAYTLRQYAIRSQFEATAAADTAISTAEILRDCLDAKLVPLLARASREAARRAIETVIQAANSVEEANAVDAEVTRAFHLVRDAAKRLSDSMDLDDE